jgi:hypothetical protein
MKTKVLMIILLFLTIGYFFIGVEIIEREHTTDYDFFIKKHPTNHFMFRNFVMCGECDFLPYSKLDNESKIQFRELCYYKHGLNDIQKCEDLFNPDKIIHK